MLHSRSASLRCTNGGRGSVAVVRHTHRPTIKAATRHAAAKSTSLRATALRDVAPAVLPGTPKAFPISEERLLSMARDLFAADSGVTTPGLLAEDFRFEFPVVSLAKKPYVKAVSGFDLKLAIPNLNSHPYHFRVDPYEPNRVWFTVRSSGTHTGTLKFNGTEFPPSGKEYLGAPECMSYTFNEAGLCTAFTGGYVMDRRVGNTQGLGALFGILAALGGPVLTPGSPAYMSLSFANTVQVGLKGIFDTATFGVFKNKEE